VIANLIGGTSYVLTKQALAGLSETMVVVVRSVVALAVLVPFAGHGLATVLRARGHDRARLLTMSVLGYAGPLVLASYGLRRSTGTNAALLIGIEPICGVLLAALVLGERLTRGRVVALVLGTLGATTIVGNGVPFVTVRYAPHLVGDLLLVAHGAGWAVYSIAGKPLLERHDPLAVSTASLAVSFPFLLPLAALEARVATWAATRRYGPIAAGLA
jgi:drug/metabolite transporter (DMT)-like permease